MDRHCWVSSREGFLVGLFSYFFFLWELFQESICWLPRQFLSSALSKHLTFHMLIRRGRIYNVLFGLFQAPYYAYAQTMMSEVTPRGYENMFFGLFGITNRAVSHRLYLSIEPLLTHNSPAS